MPIRVKAVASPVINLRPFLDFVEPLKGLDIKGVVNEVKNKLPSKLSKIDLSLAGTEKGRLDAMREWKVADASRRGELEQLKGQITDVRKNGLDAKALANQAKQTAGEAKTTASGARTTAKTAISKADSAAGAAAAAGGKAATAASLAQKALGILQLVGAAAGLLALFGLVKSVLPTLKAHDSRMDSLDKGISGVYGSVQKVDNRARAAQATASEAKQTANTANTTAQRANRKAEEANSTAARANTTATQANDRSKRNEAELERIKREGLPMNPSQYNTLISNHKTEQGQNQRMIELVQRLPTAQQEKLKIPPEILAIPVAIAAQGSIINQINRTTGTIARNTTPEAQKANSAAGTCQSFAPNACGDRAIGRHVNPLRALLDALKKQLDALNAFLNAKIISKLDFLVKKLQALEGKIAQQFKKTWTFLKLDRVLNIYNAVVATHNAYMLSSFLAQTLFHAVGNAMSFFGLKDADGQPFQVGQIISGGLDNAMKKIFGVSNWQGTKQQWKSYNRIYQAGAQMIWTVRSIGDVTRSLTEVAIENTGKIGNALRRSGAVLQDSYGWLTERGDAQTATTKKIQAFSNSLQNFENGASALESVTSDALELQQLTAEVGESRARFDEELERHREEMDDQESTKNNNSVSPPIADDDIFAPNVEN